MRKILPRGLIISCQATEGEPFYNSGVMHLFARAAKAGGAKAIRALAPDIGGIKSETGLPVIGLVKRCYEDSEVYITPTVNEAHELISTGCDVIALDATDRRRPKGVKLSDIVSHIRSTVPDTALMADISTYAEAEAAHIMGFDYISTTLRGYTENTKDAVLPDYDFIKECSSGPFSNKLVVEGGIWEAGQLEKVLEYGPYAVVIGTAVTRPKDITLRFARMFGKKTRE